MEATARGKVAIIGGGPWGIALAAAAARAGSDTVLYSRRDQGKLPKGVTQSEGFHELGTQARLVVLAVPSAVARGVVRELGVTLDGRHLVVHGVRGFVGTEMETVSDVVRDETPVRRVGALGGPVLADELAQGKPSVMVVGSNFPEVNQAVVTAFTSKSLRVYGTNDLRGLEWSSALVGCLAIGVGYAQEAGLGPGLVAAVITRAVNEAARVALAAGGHANTMLGLSGYGDLLASIAQEDRPEVLVGAALAKGKSLESALKSGKLRVEAVELIPRIVAWCEAKGVRAPILKALAEGVLAQKPHDEIVDALMTAPIEESA
ncbi:MAG: NAD(P)-binding domain-containing protein [Polyangiaceae bacterium]